MSTPKKSAIRGKPDVGWEHGKKVNGNSRRVCCNYCEGTFSGGIFRFKNHLACNGKDVRRCTKVPADVKNFFELLVSEGCDSSNKRKKDITDADYDVDYNPVKKKSKKFALGERPDEGWKHCVDVNGNMIRVCCNHCKGTFSGISRLKHHLAGTRKDVRPCTEVPYSIKMLFISLLSNKRNRGNYDVVHDSVEETYVEKTSGFPAKKKSKMYVRGDLGDSSGARNDFHNCEADLMEKHLPVATANKLGDHSATSNPWDTTGFDGTRCNDSQVAVTENTRGETITTPKVNNDPKAPERKWITYSRKKRNPEGSNSNLVEVVGDRIKRCHVSKEELQGHNPNVIKLRPLNND